MELSQNGVPYMKLISGKGIMIELIFDLGVALTMLGIGGVVCMAAILMWRDLF